MADNFTLMRAFGARIAGEVKALIGVYMDEKRLAAWLNSFNSLLSLQARG